MARACYGPTCRVPKAIRATKVLQADLLRQAEALRENPKLAVPTCRGDHRGCPFPKAEAQMERVASIAGDKRRLEKLSKRGDPLVRAYAGTLLLTHAEGAPYLASSQVGNTSVPFAVRGKTKKEMLLGVQHFDDPFLRLLTVAEIAEKKGLFIFSLDEGLVCMGREPVPPPEYLPQVLKGSGYALVATDGGYACPHGTDGEDVLAVRWPAAGSEVVVCHECASDEVSLGRVLAHRMVAPRSATVFQVAGIPHFECRTHGEECPLCRESRLAESDMFPYLVGGLTDLRVLEKVIAQALSRAEGSGLYAANGVCYGEDLDAFAASLRGTEAERRALRAVLEADGTGWVGDGTTLRKILATHWDAHSEAALAAVSDEEVARAVLDRHKGLEPAALIRVALQEREKGRVRDALPDYVRLPPVAALADRFARSCRFKGRQEAAKEIASHDAASRVERVVSYAFLLAIGEGAGKEWKYTADEVDLATFLKDFAGQMTDATGEAYHEALQHLLTASGSGESIKYPKR